MQMLRNKTKIATIAFVLMLTIAATALTCLPANAWVDIPEPTPSQIPPGTVRAPTYAGLYFAPNPVGVGQQVLVGMCLNVYPPSTGTENINVTVGGWHGWKLTITKPDGTIVNMGPYESDVMGTKTVAYVPDKVGAYKFKFDFPGELILNASFSGMAGAEYQAWNAYFLPSTTTKTLTVQQEPVPTWSETPIPFNQYWSRPITSENRDWAHISGPWLQSTYNATGTFNPYTTAPNSAHILWTKQINPVPGGLIGGDDYGPLKFTTAMGFSSPVIMNGYVYYNGPGGKFYCMDLSTGDDMWSASGSITQGQILNWHQTDYPYLWSISGSTWRMYDPNTGTLLVSFTGVTVPTYLAYAPVPSLSPITPSAARITGGGGGGYGGEVLVYVAGLTSNNQSTWIACWNSTKAVISYSKNTVQWMSGVSTGASIPWKGGIQWNVTIPYVHTVYVSKTRTNVWPGIKAITGPLVVAKIGGDVIFLYRSRVSYEALSNATAWPMGALDRFTGKLLWVKNQTVQPYQQAGANGASAWCPVTDGVVTFYLNDQMKLVGYNVYSGQELWSVEPFENDFIIKGSTSTTATNGYGNLYYAGVDGYLHCIDLKTGKQTWDTIGRAGSFETSHENYAMGTAPTVADGKVYTSTSQSADFPLVRGLQLFCYNAFTGQKMWNISGSWGTSYIADGYLLNTNGYDGLVYCFGKGKTATTVSAPLTSVTNGSTILIQGTVLDQSLGAEGTPAISDQWMTPWMEYLYMDQPAPAGATGVPVQLSAISPDGTVINIGTVTSDTDGNYVYSWCLPSSVTPGAYRIVATFLGSESYWTSWAETGLSVVTAGPSAPASAVEAPAVPDYTPLFAGLIVAVVVTICLVIYTLYTVRKQRK